MVVRKQIASTADLGKMIRESRKAQGLTQKQVAGMTNVGRRFISDIENGKDTAQVGKAIYLIRKLGVVIELVRHWRDEA